MHTPCATPPEPLRGGGVALRKWETEDAEWYVSARDSEVYAWTTETPTLTLEATREAIRRNGLTPLWVGLAVTDAESGALLGNLALRPTGEGPGEGEVSYWLALEGRGRGAATEAVRLLVNWAFESGAFRRLILVTKPGNTRSQAVALRAGFTLEDADAVRCRFSLERSDEP